MARDSNRRELKPPVPGQLLFPIPQLAMVLGVSTRFAWELVLSNKIKSTVIGRRRLVHIKEVERFASRSHESPFAKEKQK